MEKKIVKVLPFVHSFSLLPENEGWHNPFCVFTLINNIFPSYPNHNANVRGSV